MKIGLIKEIKENEHRVAITPNGVRELVDRGHSVCVTFEAGVGSGYSDDDYISSGATICHDFYAWDSDLVVKVKEPQVEEYKYFNGQILFTYLHLAGVDKELTLKLLSTNTTAIAYESITDNFGNLPLLSPMSAIAGNMAVTIGSYYLQYTDKSMFFDGSGVQLGKINGVNSGNVVVVGDGVVGRHAAEMANGMGANVIILGLETDYRWEYLSRGHMNTSIEYKCSTSWNLEPAVKDADLVIGAVSIPGKKSPIVVTEDMVKSMRKGSVVVDVSIDQGGCIETSQMRSHQNPVFMHHGVIHYCVSNMPGAYPKSATNILTKATLPYIAVLADMGLDNVDPNFTNGIYTHNGRITNLMVAESLELMEYYEE
jgi:alanine dehydrogenase